MDWERGDAQSGQASILLGGIVLLCIVAVLLFAVVLRGDFRSSGEQIQRPAQPRALLPSPQHAWPTTFAECENGGWRNFSQAENEESVSSTSTTSCRQGKCLQGLRRPVGLRDNRFRARADRDGIP